MTHEEIARLEEQLSIARDTRERIILLDRLSQAYISADIQKSIEYARKALRLSRRLKDDVLTALSLFRIAQHLIGTNKSRQAETKLKAAILFLDSTEERLLRAEIYWKLGEVLHQRGDLDGALERYERSREIFTEARNSRMIAIVDVAIALVYQYQGKFVQAYALVDNALEIVIAIEDIEVISHTIASMGTLLLYLQDCDMALLRSNECLDIARESGHQNCIIQCLANIGVIYGKQQDYGNALRYFLESLEACDGGVTAHFKAIISGNVAMTYLAMDRNADALAYVHKSLDASAARNDPFLHALTLITAALIFFELKDYDNVLSHGERALEFSRRHPGIAYDPNIHRVLSLTYEQRNEHALALVHSRRYADLLTAQPSIADGRKVAGLQAKRELEKKELEKKELKAQTRQLEAELKQQNRELTSLALSLAQKGEFVKGLRGKLVSMHEQADQNGDMVAKKMVSEIDHLEDGSADWQIFELQFRKVHPDFTTTLLRQYPHLSKSEIRICLFLKINLSNREIADLLSITIRGVEQHRLRIRKKIGLAPDNDLVTFLAKI